MGGESPQSDRHGPKKTCGHKTKLFTVARHFLNSDFSLTVYAAIIREKKGHRKVALSLLLGEIGGTKANPSPRGCKLHQAVTDECDMGHNLLKIAQKSCFYALS